MRELKVTGIAQENDFDSDGQVQYLLVINKGELRIPVSQEAAQQVLQLIYSNGHNKVTRQESVGVDKLAEDEAEREGEEDEVFGGEEEDGSTDEDGVDQV